MKRVARRPEEKREVENKKRKDREKKGEPCTMRCRKVLLGVFFQVDRVQDDAWDMLLISNVGL